MSEKQIKSDEDLKYFESHCPAHAIVLRHLEKNCLLAKGKVGIPVDQSGPEEQGIISLLDSISEQLNSFPPIKQPMRFGNKAFRNFHEWLEHSSISLITTHILPNVNDASLLSELRTYLNDSFGNPVRIDFGTGHELAFMAFIIVLCETKHLPETSAIPLIIFRKYFSLVRAITTQYQMEPAGSHGVWGLDDYHHLPFLIGSAQLIGHETDVCKPTDSYKMCDTATIPFNLFMDNVAYVKRTKCKHAPFHEVAPVLSDLTSRSENWTVVCYTLMQMYKVEVLGKRPIMQHFYFGKYIPWK